MTGETFENFVLGIRDALADTVDHDKTLGHRAVGYAEGVDAATEPDFGPNDYDAASLFERYFA